MTEDEKNRVNDFAEAILHGDEHHRNWLLAAAEAFTEDKPLPKQPPPKEITDPEQIELQCFLSMKEVNLSLVREAVQSQSDTLDSIANIMKSSRLAVFSSEWFFIQGLIEATGRNFD